VINDMRLYTSTDGYAETVDLDDINIYSQEWQKMDIYKLFLKCMSEAGDSLFYMDFLHANIDYSSQRKRVAILCRELSNIWHFTRQFSSDTYKYTLLNEPECRMALMSWLYRFQDETENQC